MDRKERDGGGDGPSFADLWRKWIDNIKKRQTPRFIRSLSAVWGFWTSLFFLALFLLKKTDLLGLSFFLAHSLFFIFGDTPFVLGFLLYLSQLISSQFFPGEGKRAFVCGGWSFKCVANCIACCFPFRLKYHFHTVLKPGEGARALRFHDLSRRAKRVVGRSDAVLHRFGEA